MSFTDLFWVFIVFTTVLPWFQRRLLEAARLRAIRDLERLRGSRVITMIHRQEQRSLFGFSVAFSTKGNGFLGGFDLVGMGEAMKQGTYAQVALLRPFIDCDKAEIVRRPVLEELARRFGTGLVTESGITRQHAGLVRGEFREVEMAMAVDQHGGQLQAAFGVSTKRGNTPWGAGSGVPGTRAWSGPTKAKLRCAAGTATRSRMRADDCGITGWVSRPKCRMVSART